MYTNYTNHDEATTTNYKFAAMRQLQKNNSNYKSKTESYIVDKLETLRTFLQDWGYENKVYLNYRKKYFAFKVDRNTYVRDSISKVEEILFEYNFIKTETVNSITYKVQKEDLIAALS
jgi:hypothetical protein